MIGKKILRHRKIEISATYSTDTFQYCQKDNLARPPQLTRFDNTSLEKRGRSSH